MKLLIIPVFLTANLHAQNTGIGTNTPTEKLDVHGNINITGVIKTNGTDGAPGQVLTRGSGNTLQWATVNANTSATENFQVFTATTAGAVQTFTVPAGVTKITAEAWGGGGTGGAGSAT
ncbi:MAG: hypothetical protein JNM68_15745, partial [Dinghuibacter sp.]|nr:hypothetical protein [Dinghuibacter sp.]